MTRAAAGEPIAAVVAGRRLCAVSVPNIASAGAGGAYEAIGHIGGSVLVAWAFFAYYAGMALVVNSSWKRTIFPVGGEP
ncbi:MAG TPA: hypothetical protein VLX44_18875 [Xanthobacteraceae bacterium]|nr:hypothetical protein [Xanthobacteraceae bacterium]